MQHATGMSPKKMLKKRRQPWKNMHYVDSIYIFVAPPKIKTLILWHRKSWKGVGMEMNTKGQERLSEVMRRFYNIAF